MKRFANINAALHKQEERLILEKMGSYSLARKKNTVILHTSTKGSLKYGYGATFTGKVESYLQYNSIPYIVDATSRLMPLPMHKSPWITLNGVHTADSQMIIERLNYEFNINNDSHLTTLQQAISGIYNEAMDRLYFIDIYRRYMDDENCTNYVLAVLQGESLESSKNKDELLDESMACEKKEKESMLMNEAENIKKQLQPYVKDQLWSQGIGRFNDGDIVYDKLCNYVNGVLDYMKCNDNSKFFFANDRLSCIDFAIYSQFGSMYSLPQLKFVNLSPQYEEKYQYKLPRKEEMMRYIKDVQEICESRSKKVSLQDTDAQNLSKL